MHLSREERDLFFLLRNYSIDKDITEQNILNIIICYSYNQDIEMEFEYINFLDFIYLQYEIEINKKNILLYLELEILKLQTLRNKLVDEKTDTHKMIHYKREEFIVVNKIQQIKIRDELEYLYGQIFPQKERIGHIEKTIFDLKQLYKFTVIYN